LHAGYLRLRKKKICFSGATIFTRTRFNVTMLQCLSLVWPYRSWRNAAGAHCKHTNAGHRTTGRITCFTVLHKNANPVIFYASPTCCSNK
jgi:hypothetical protein